MGTYIDKSSKNTLKCMNFVICAYNFCFKVILARPHFLTTATFRNFESATTSQTASNLETKLLENPISKNISLDYINRNYTWCISNGIFAFLASVIMNVSGFVMQNVTLNSFARHHWDEEEENMNCWKLVLLKNDMWSFGAQLLKKNSDCALVDKKKTEW